MVELPSSGRWNGTGFRNFYTCYPSQDLFDDLSDNLSDFSAAHLLSERTKTISMLSTSYTVPFSYGEIPEILKGLVPSWHLGRFGDGLNYAIWYGSTDRETSIAETFFHQEKKFFAEKNFMKESQFISHRKMISVNITGEHFLDARECVNKYPQLMSSEDYTFCQQFGAISRSRGDDGIISASVRHATAANVNLFNHKCFLETDRFCCYLRFVFEENKAPRILMGDFKDITSNIVGL